MTKVGESLRERRSPKVRRLLATHRVDPAAITGTGAGGRLTACDIEQSLTRQIPEPARDVAGTERPGLSPSAAAPSLVAAELELEVPAGTAWPEAAVLVACMTSIAADFLAQAGASGPPIGVAAFTASYQWVYSVLEHPRDYTLRKLAADVAAASSSEPAPDVSLQVVDLTAVSGLTYAQPPSTAPLSLVLADLGPGAQLAEVPGGICIARRRRLRITAVHGGDPLNTDVVPMLAAIRARLLRQLEP